MGHVPWDKFLLYLCVIMCGNPVLEFGIIYVAACYSAKSQNTHTHKGF